MHFNPAIPPKTYDYLAAGMPVLAYGPKNSYLQKFLSKHGVGIYIEGNNPEKIAEGIRYLLSIADKLRLKARKVANEYSRTESAQKLVDIIEKVINKN